MPVSSCIELTANAQQELATLVWQVLDGATRYQSPSLPSAPQSKELERFAATFVTLLVNDNLNGCIGCYQAHLPIWQSACQHAYSSAIEDYRFDRLNRGHLANLTVKLSILSSLSKQDNNGEQALVDLLECNRCGVLLEYKDKSAIFLPSVWQYFQHATDFLMALKDKAGWSKSYWHKDIDISLFQTSFYTLKKTKLIS